jgi:predicted transcriptional regulator
MLKTGHKLTAPDSDGTLAPAREFKPRAGRRKAPLPGGDGVPALARLSRLELTCLNVLWQKPELSVREVRQALLPHKPVAYTTVLTILDRMFTKGAVRRFKHGKTYFYQPAISREEACRQAVHSLLDLYFAGSVDELLNYLRQSAVQSPVPVSAWDDIPENLL